MSLKLLYLFLFLSSTLAIDSDPPILSITTELVKQKSPEKSLRQNITVMSDSKPTTFFLCNKEFCTCKNTPVFTEKHTTQYRIFTVTSPTDLNIPIKATLFNYYYPDMNDSIVVQPEILKLEAGQPKEFKLMYEQTRNKELEKIVRVELDDVRFEYVKQCYLDPQRDEKYLYAAATLLGIAVVVIAIAAKQDQFQFIQESGEADMYEIQSLSVKQVLGVLAIASCVLFGFYLMIKFFSLIWLVTIFFLFSITFLLIPLFAEVIDYLAKGNVYSICNLAIMKESVKLKFIASTAIAVSLVLYWYITRNWLACNLIGCLCVIVILKMMRLNKLMPGILLLSALFFYDIFWVFLSPYIFGGESVMMVVATNVDLPAKLQFPHYNFSTIFTGANPFVPCALIGLGDLAVPGFYISYISRFGDYMNAKVYLISHLIAYFLSICACIYVISLGNGGQPALLYIVPALFIATFIVGKLRGEMSDLFEGLPSALAIKRTTIEYDNNEIDHDSSELHEFNLSDED
ncbi:unnamed protein product [Moneuplotes crassus]|uniref:Signal peptide peptidase family protein n=1 Tax=Euplotes crassus TaxID=5936 RepID=A0AAD1UAW0_EUPCR|nr:unnamed protein product [Moneuplotes crassus]